MPVQPSKTEDEYFARQEIEKRRAWEKEHAAKMEFAEREKLRELHHMKCPKCGMDLQPIKVQGIEIDTCGGCGGVWLDHGELDAMLARDKNEGILSKVLSVFE